MSNIIDARVIQKTDTEDKWIQNDLKLYKGELALVQSADNVVNIKVGTGNKTFRELPYLINYVSGLYTKSITKNSRPSGDNYQAYIATEVGFYPNFGNVELPKGFMGVIFKNLNNFEVSLIKIPNEDDLQTYINEQLVDANLGFGGQLTDLNQSPTVEGIYVPKIEGTYPNFDNLTYDSSEGLVMFLYKDGQYEKISIPLDAVTNEVTNINTGVAVSGQAVEKHAVKKINNVAELRNTQGEYEGQIIELLGYYDIGEYSLKYKWSNTQGVDDGGYIINANSGSWVAQFETSINIANYGVKTNEDNTLLIQTALNKTSELGLVLEFNEGEYLIDGTINNNRGLRIRSNTTLKTTLKTIFKVIPNSSESYGVITFLDAENININYLNLIGERTEHLGTTGEWGMGVTILRSKNINIETVECKDFWGDGFYIGHVNSADIPNSNIKIGTLISDNNRRQALSLVSVDGLTIDTAILTNTNGTSPEAGVDFEPNFSTGKLKNITINNLITKNNKGGGLIVVPLKLDDTSDYVDININNMYSEGEIAVFHAGNWEKKVKGLVNINSVTSINASGNSISFRNCYNTLNWNIGYVYSYNANQSNLATNFGSAIRIANNSNDTYYPEREASDITISKIEIISTDNKIDRPILVREFNRADSQPSIKFKYDNLNYNGGRSAPLIISSLELGTLNVLNTSNSLSMGRELRSNNHVTNQGATQSAYISMNPYYKGFRVTLEVKSAFTFGIQNVNNFKIFGYETLNEGYIWSQTVGSTIVLENVSDNIWKIVNFTGVWNSSIGQLRNGSNVSSANIYGLVKQSNSVVNISTADATDLATALTLVNELKAKLNAKLTADRNSGQQAT